tara:strand:- start:470 stop:916 length:447 start_codon:yes stop_codon:yes gene_type:complete
MADLVTTISESVTLNGAVRGSSNSVTTTGINNVMERIVTCINGNVTTIATFATTPHTSAGAIDVENVRYVRVTNLDTTNSIELAIVATGTNYQVTLTGGNSHILSIGEEVAFGETGTSPAFGTLQDLASLQVSPKAADAQVELFVGLV